MGKAIRYGIAVAIVVVFAFCTYIVNKTIITNGVNSIEENQAKEAMVQVQNYIRFIVGQMNQRMVDWACWDEAYAYMKVPKQSFLDNNFDEDFLTEQNISFAFFYTDNQALYNFIDTKNEKNVQTEEKLAVSSRLVQKLYASKDDLVSGLARIGPLFYVIAAHRIYDGKQSLPPNGALVMASPLDERFIQKAKNDEVLVLALKPADAQGTESTTLQKTESTLEVFHSGKNVFGGVGYTIHLSLKRSIANLGQKMSLQNFLLILGLGVSLLLTGLSLLHYNEQKIMQRELAYRENHDSLTQLLNKKGILEQITQLISEKSDEPSLLLSLDIDRFKVINDTYGHSVGDRLLLEIGQRLNGLELTNYCARLSGDEFLIIVLKAAKSPQEYAEEVLASLREPFCFDEKSVHVGASLGAVRYPEDGKDAYILIRRAELAMYTAKRLGGNTYSFFTQEMDLKLAQKTKLESELYDAVENGTLQVFYQPKVDSVHLKVVGLEGLVRWQKADGSWVPPSDFIPLAEEINLVSKIDMFVFKTACHQNRSWYELGCAVPISVNMSARSILSDNFSESVLGILHEEALPASLIEIEITETSLMTHLDVASRGIDAVNREGIRIAIDDFGTGYSSLLYLHTLPISCLKIDKKFIDDINKKENTKSRNLVKAIVSLAHDLGIAIIAEGVEERPQLNFLIANNCPTIQGYFFSKPLNTNECQIFLQSQYERINAKLHPKSAC